MNNDEYELTLFDRIEVIKLVNQQHDLEHNGYISFSGGKDSTILHYLIDKALPNNRIPRVFINTGIEYNDIVAFVKELASNDDRFVILTPKVPIKPMLEQYGYPFKSKEHSLYVYQFQKNGICKTTKRYLEPKENRKTFGCPTILKYQFTQDFKLKLSNKCCFKLKKEPIHLWQQENNRTITLTGMRAEEGGTRSIIKGCILTDKKGKVIKFHPLIKVNEEWENEFIKQQNIKLCKLYYPPYSFKRTGCKGCPYSLALNDQLQVMAKYLPNERKQCEVIWKPVYDEYRRLNYRLKEHEQLDLFELLDNEK